MCKCRSVEVWQCGSVEVCLCEEVIDRRSGIMQRGSFVESQSEIWEEQKSEWLFSSGVAKRHVGHACLALYMLFAAEAGRNP